MIGKLFRKTTAGGVIQEVFDGAGEGIRTPASTKPTSWLALCAVLDLEASAITTPPPRHG